MVVQQETLKVSKGGQCFRSPGMTEIYRSSFLYGLKRKYTLNLQMNRGFSPVLNNTIIIEDLTCYKYDHYKTLEKTNITKRSIKLIVYQ